MVILREPHMDCQFKYIGIIAPKPYLTGGHDNNDLRISIKNKIHRILLSEKPNNIIGLTCLNFGLEQDFAALCSEERIDYIYYKSFDEQQLLWQSIPEYEGLLLNYIKKAYDTQDVYDGIYSPKKIIATYKELIKASHTVIVVTSVLKPYKELIEYAEQLNKQVIQLELKEHNV